jgi:hypothetical protein
VTLCGRIGVVGEWYHPLGLVDDIGWESWGNGKHGGPLSNMLVD